MNNEVVNANVLADPEVKPVTAEMVKRVYPKRINDELAQQCADLMNDSLTNLNSIEKIHFRDNLIGLMDCLNPSDRKAPSLQEYISAVKFVTYKHMGHSDTKAYAFTFPDRIQRMIDEKVPQTHLWAYANKYSKSKVVVDVHTKMLVPVHIMFQDYFAQAVKTQADLMINATSEKVRSDAANSLMTHLKPPEVKKAEISISTQDSGVIGDLANALSALSDSQRTMIQSGKMTIDDISKAEIIELDKDDYEGNINE